ncbi:MAG: hypothetical protein H7A24_04925 [Leptospiraceae bacterium]|nr:hypothetical protein [Leptospiraceae bacterium]MCP5511199.1 hypothetical protein [Leptospiraceae bacterium]
MNRRLLLLILLIFSRNLFPVQPKHIHGFKETGSYTNFFFLYEKESVHGQEEVIFRPFFSGYREDLSGSYFKTSFFPLFSSIGTKKWNRTSYLLFFGGDTTYHDDSGEDTDFGIAPFLFWGKGDTAKENYFSFFPFFGRFQSKFSWSRIEFFAFPVFASWEYRDYKAYSLLWPIFLYGDNGIRKERRFFPFYSNKSHTGKYERVSLFWPFWSYGRENLDKREPFSYSFLWLIYSYKKSYYGNMKSVGIVPILGSISLFSYGFDNKTSEENYNLLFFLQYGSNNDKDYRKHIFFPFYGYSRFANKEFRFLTPFLISMNTNSYHVRSKFRYLIPFSFYQKSIYPGEDGSQFYYKLWPLFKWEEDRSGNFTFNTLTFFPIHSITMDKIYDPIVSLIEYKHLGNGEKRFSLFMRLYSQEWTDTKYNWRIPILLSYHSNKDESNFQFAHGLFGYKKEPKKTEFQFFWIFKI